MLLAAAHSQISMARDIRVAKVSSMEMFVSPSKELSRSPGRKEKESGLLAHGLKVTQRRCISKLASRSHKRVRSTQNYTHYTVCWLPSFSTVQAFLAYEANELPGLKEAKPGLKLRQYKQMLFEQVWNVFYRP